MSRTKYHGQVKVINCEVFPVVCRLAGRDPDKCTLTRERHIAFLRQVAQYVQWYVFKVRTVEIARRYGLAHTTVGDAISKLIEMEDHPFVVQCINHFKTERHAESEA